MSKSKIIIKPVRSDRPGVSMDMEFETEDAIRIMTYALQLWAHRQSQQQVTSNVEIDLVRGLAEIKK